MANFAHVMILVFCDTLMPAPIIIIYVTQGWVSQNYLRICHIKTYLMIILRIILTKKYAAAMLSLVLRHEFKCRRISNNLMIIIIKIWKFCETAKIDLMKNFGLMTNLSHKIVL